MAKKPEMPPPPLPVAAGEQGAELQVVDNPYAPQIHFDGFAGIMVRDHTVKINLTAMQSQHPRIGEHAQEIVIARLAISTTALARVYHVLSGVVNDMQERGIVPRFDPKTETFTWETPPDEGEKDHRK